MKKNTRLVKKTRIKKEEREKKQKEGELENTENKQTLVNINDKTYFSAMRLVEESMWTRWSLLKLDPETREIQATMFKVLNGLGLMYQVKFVSIYLMILMRNTWEEVQSNMGKCFANKSYGYKYNLLIISCIFISSNYEELEPPNYSNIVQAVQENGFEMKSGEKMIRKQVHILERLAWRLTGFQIELPSANSFLMQIIQNSNLPKTSKFKVSRLSTEIIHNSLNSEIITKYKQSLIATSSITLAITIEFETHPKKKQLYIDNVVAYSGYCRKEIASIQRILRKTSLDRK
ncbi:cyclin A [Cryptosporidium ubiquitum]|uniref:Cyclin A n=1 Tax=Cryptosporidium ubiquitum TaxID=857276 RepID=A0A1J4MKG4_9CRYT|nr:cyclin A [Cryptosporidium ubiquitum]OII73939.1 cyclin A [Cryptosporidium ubiquitum]